MKTNTIIIHYNNPKIDAFSTRLNFLKLPLLNLVPKNKLRICVDIREPLRNHFSFQQSALLLEVPSINYMYYSVYIHKQINKNRVLIVYIYEIRLKVNWS